MFLVVICILLLFIYMSTVVDQLPRLGKRELICLLLFTCNYVVSVWRGSLFLWVLGMGYVILLWHSLSLPYNYFGSFYIKIFASVCRYQKWLLQVSYSFLCTCECDIMSDWIMSEICDSIFCDILSETPRHEQSHS